MGHLLSCGEGKRPAGTGQWAVVPGVGGTELWLGGQCPPETMSFGVRIESRAVSQICRALDGWLAPISAALVSLHFGRDPHTSLKTSHHENGPAS